ncbi:hypothetical protein Tco_0227841 [Tanacetum coccineum]
MDLESRCIHEGRVVFQIFDNLVYVGSMFSHIDFECLLEINEQIVPRFILEFYSNYRVSYTLEGQMLIEFVIQNQFFSYTIEEFGLILGIPSNGACSFTDKWSLDELQYSVPMSGPYQTNPPCLDEIKNYCPELSKDSYVLCDRIMYPLTAQQERKTRKDYNMRRGHSSTSSSSAFGQPSSSHLNDDDNDGNDKGISRVSTPSPTRFVISLPNDIP